MCETERHILTVCVCVLVVCVCSCLGPDNKVSVAAGEESWLRL